MANREEEVIEAELVECLKEFNLSEYEAQTLVALTRLGTGTAKDVANVGDVPRTRVYDAVEALHEMGLVDVQHTTPRKFIVVSSESIVRKLDVERENTIAEAAELLAELEPADPQQEQAGVWTVTGHEAVAQRVVEFLDEAEDEIIYMTVDELLTEGHLEHLRDAHERGVEIHLAGISEEVQARIQDTVPSAELFETLWEWADTPAGSLLVTDKRTALVSVRTNGRESGGVEETAVWGSGERNSLVVVLRAIFTWRLGTNDLPSGGDS
ncbi:MAG: TrmB family transcriptional regulator [Haloplanus sp.]